MPETTTAQMTETVAIEFAWVLTLSYETPRGTATVTRLGKGHGVPGVHTRAELIAEIVSSVKRQINQPSAVVVFLSLERNEL